MRELVSEACVHAHQFQTMPQAIKGHLNSTSLALLLSGCSFVCVRVKFKPVTLFVLKSVKVKVVSGFRMCVMPCPHFIIGF